ncbi:hypothetical protein [Nostoc sp.]
MPFLFGSPLATQSVVGQYGSVKVISQNNFTDELGKQPFPPTME